MDTKKIETGGYIVHYFLMFQADWCKLRAKFSSKEQFPSVLVILIQGKPCELQDSGVKPERPTIVSSSKHTALIPNQSPIEASEGITRN